MDSTSYDSIRTNNEEDTQTLCFKPSAVHSLDELRDEIHRIGSNISTVDTKWTSRVDSIQTIGNLICGGILESALGEDFVALLFEIRDGICTQITELRSGITKEICRVLSYLAISIDECRAKHVALKQQAQPLVDYVVPFLVKQTRQTILAISHLSNLALRTIVKRLPLSKALGHLIQNTHAAQQKSVCSRVRCLEYLRIVVEVQPYHRHYLRCHDTDALAAIVEAVTRCVSDPHPSVRLVARQTVWSLAAIYPQRDCAHHILSKISPQNQKYVASEKQSHRLLPPPIGIGHKVDLKMGRNAQQRPKGLTASASTASLHLKSKRALGAASSVMAANAAHNRPRSALPSRKHRLELLKKKKAAAAGAKGRRKKDGGLCHFERPQTAQPRCTPQAVGTKKKRNRETAAHRRRRGAFSAHCAHRRVGRK